MRFVARSVIRTTPAELFAFHELPGVIERLTPSWEHSRLIEQAETLRSGGRSLTEVRIAWFFRTLMESVHTSYDPPFSFADEQVRGPFRKWHHRHVVESHPEGAVLIDEIDFEPPFGIIGRVFAPLLILPRLRRLFAYRHRVTRDYCERN